MAKRECVLRECQGWAEYPSLLCPEHLEMVPGDNKLRIARALRRSLKTSQLGTDRRVARAWLNAVIAVIEKVRGWPKGTGAHRLWLAKERIIP